MNLAEAKECYNTIPGMASGYYESGKEKKFEYNLPYYKIIKMSNLSKNAKKFINLTSIFFYFVN